MEDKIKHENGGFYPIEQFYLDVIKESGMIYRKPDYSYMYKGVVFSTYSELESKLREIDG